ncbi:pirin family protein [Reichenbachiella agarivorans]|uniref:Pirin family protein n=1 Tax=Reichenbachiella agarivorans TaxID=2979464 RepID=A0ABY6CMQ5_9BACT|nr:pirin family protein [Reichenbachiella agarivorans]UXP31794.1 pirin family protein [Reichenbachiella agarivorans]
MSNNKMLVNERQRDLGNFMVGRLLPFREKRQVGPFTFIDHMGPAAITTGRYIDVDQHPHIGLSTLTYLFEGEIEHRDSTGSFQVIHPGDAGFMTAGKGVTHTERTPVEQRDGAKYSMHGYQIWVALPKDKEDMEPRFDYYPAQDLPRWEEAGLSIVLVAGTAFGRQSPLTGYSSLFMVDVHATNDTHLELKNQLKGEVAFVIVKGSITDEGETIEAGQMMISKTDEECGIELKKGTRLLLFGGEPLPEERFLLWNFVSSSKEKLQQAKADWQAKRFPKVAGDNTYIPFP